MTDHESNLLTPPAWINFCQTLTEISASSESKTSCSSLLHQSFQWSFTEPYREKSAFSPMKGALLQKMFGDKWFEIWNESLPAIASSNASSSATIQKNIRCWIAASTESLQKLTALEWYVLFSNCV